MNIQIQQIFTLDDVDFDTLFDSSFPDMDMNYFLLASDQGPTESKKEMYRARLSDALTDISPLQTENTYVFGFKVMLDGVDHLMNAGFVDYNTGIFASHWFLTKPYNNSRNFIHSADYRTQRSQFFRDNEIYGYQVTTPINSLLYKSIKSSSNIDHLELIEEVPLNLANMSNIVKLIVRVL